MGIQVGRWDCPYCGHIGNLGPETVCAGCGAPRDDDVEFYLPEDSEYVSDEKELEKASQGPDWVCEFCGSDNKAIADVCRSCGNTRSDSDGKRKEKEYDLDEVPRSQEDTREETETKDVPPPSPPSGIKKKIIIAAVLLVVIIILGFLFSPRKDTFTVAGFSWERAVDTEIYRLVEEEGWKLPQDAVETIRSYQDVHHYDRVIDHYETKTRTKKVKVGEEQYVCGKIDKGNGYFKDKYCTRAVYEDRKETYKEPVYRKKPVYRTKYVYKVNRWETEETYKKNGTKKPARWPEFSVEGKNRREGKRRETYRLILQDKEGGYHEVPVSYDIWQQMDIKEKVPVKVGVDGEVTLDLE